MSRTRLIFLADLVAVAEAAATWAWDTDPAARTVAVIFALGAAFIVRQIET